RRVLGTGCSRPPVVGRLRIRSVVVSRPIGATVFGPTEHACPHTHTPHGVRLCEKPPTGGFSSGISLNTVFSRSDRSEAQGVRVVKAPAILPSRPVRPPHVRLRAGSPLDDRP